MPPGLDLTLGANLIYPPSTAHGIIRHGDGENLGPAARQPSLRPVVPRLPLLLSSTLTFGLMLRSRALLISPATIPSRHKPTAHFRSPFISHTLPAHAPFPPSSRAVSPSSTAFTPNRSLTPLSTAFTQRPRGCGAPVTGHLSPVTFSRPLFSYSYELLFPQPFYFHNHPYCPGGVG